MIISVLRTLQSIRFFMFAESILSSIIILLSLALTSHKVHYISICPWINLQILTKGLSKQQYLLLQSKLVASQKAFLDLTNEYVSSDLAIMLSIIFIRQMRVRAKLLAFWSSLVLPAELVFESFLSKKTFYPMVYELIF